ncbi:MAG: phosphodiester glycosidase family protein [Lachnospiraceae bacterium]|nr:phosphodiester glycosidase family protein [Lachnospiraceae bacterium]
MYRKISHILFAAFLAAYTIFTLLDTFVLPKDLMPVTATAFAEDESSTKEQAAGETEETYAAGGTETGDDTKSIEVTEITVSDTQVYIADIYLSDPSQLMTAVAENTFGRNVTDKTSSMAEENGALLAINGDYYGFRDSGYVMRNGYLYRSTARSGSGNEDLVVYADGTMDIIDESDVTAEELSAAGAVQIFSFGPGLVEDGEIAVGTDTEVDQSRSSNPRTAIGMIEPGHYVMVVSDGRTSESEGLTLYELAEIMQELGCTEAYNLDGGGSSTMYYNGEVINNPTSGRNKIKERSVSDIVYIAV